MTGTGLESGNRLKLGTFGTNLASGCTATLMPDRHRLEWPNLVAIAKAADDLGFELQVPVARWRPTGDQSDYNGANFETLTWAAGLGAVTSRSAIFATTHIPLIHPVFAAKQMTTIDHITNGRFGLNLVVGWNGREFGMFGRPPLQDSERYAFAAEWIELVRRLWSEEDEFDFDGQYFQAKGAYHQPKPVRKPFPPIMNAAHSPAGLDFLAKYADLGFLMFDNEDTAEDWRRKCGGITERAARHERRVGLWSYAWVVCRETEQEARDYVEYCIGEQGDQLALAGAPAAMLPRNPLRHRDLLGGWGAFHLVGTPQQIVDKLAGMSEAGLDGIILSWPNYLDGIETWAREVEPLLRKAGLRV